MRMLTLAFLLLLGNDGGRARVPVQGHHGSQPSVAAASQGALLAAAPVQKDVDPALAPLLASEALVSERPVQSAPAPAREFPPLRSRERTTGEAARPPPFQS
jgi:hypothetical protein